MLGSYFVSSLQLSGLQMCILDLNWKLSFSPQNYAPDIGAVKRKPAITRLTIKMRKPATLLPAKHSLWLRIASWISAMWLQRQKLVPPAAQQQALTMWTQEGDSTSVPGHWHPCSPKGQPKRGQWYRKQSWNSGACKSQMWEIKNRWPWVENGKKSSNYNTGPGLSSSTWAKWPHSIKDVFGRGPTWSCSAIPGHTLGELRWQGMCASGMRLDRLCLGKVVYPTNRVEDRNSLITTLLSPKGFLHSKSSCCPLQAAPVAALPTHEMQLPRAALYRAALSGRGAHCVPLTLPGGVEASKV